MKRKRIVIAGLIVLTITIFMIIILTDSSRRHRPYEADVSNVKIDPVNIFRFENILFNLNPFDLRNEIEPYIDDYYFFLGDEIDNPLAQQQLFDYITDPVIIDLYHKTMDVFPDLTVLENELTEAFTYYRYYFPGSDIPKVYSYVSGMDLAQPVKFGDSAVAVALDMYLGSDFKKYRHIGIPSYQIMRRSPEFIVRDVMYAIGEAKIRDNFKPETLIDFMVYEGMKLYFLDCMIPHTHDTLKVRYTLPQEYWIEINQGHVWSYFIDNQLLFSTNRHKINSFITDAPFTAPFSKNSSPRAAVWIGWQIVREYMRRNRDVSLNELIVKTDAEKILNRSRYKP